MSKCKECEEIHERILRAETRDELDRWVLKRKIHHRHVKDERGVYHMMRKKAESNEEGWVSMIIDGMDQRKTNIPSAGGSRDRDDSETLQTRIVGVKVHGRGKFFYLIPPNFPHTDDVTWSIIMDVLNRLGLPSAETNRIWIQMDNTCADNKTKLSVALLKLLVSRVGFKEAVLGFLPVGHTHEDIDALFSVIATYLKKFPQDTFDGLLDAIRDAFRRSGDVFACEMKVDQLRDIHHFVGTVFKSKDLQGISEQHCFRFVDTMTFPGGGNLQLQYKEWMKQIDWIRSNDVIPVATGRRFVRPSLFAWDVDLVRRIHTRLEKRAARWYIEEKSKADGGILAERARQYAVARADVVDWWGAFDVIVRRMEVERCKICLQLRRARQALRLTAFNDEAKRELRRKRARLAKELSQHRLLAECKEMRAVALEESHRIERLLTVIIYIYAYRCIPVD